MTKPSDEPNPLPTDAEDPASQPPGGGPQESGPAVSTAPDPARAAGQPSENDADVAALPASVVARFGRLLPTAIVLVALAVLGFWGHKTGWKISKFSTLTGNEEQSDRDWCAAHGVPASICVSCKADLLPKGKLYGWCKKHGTHECLLCNPELPN